MAPLWSVLGKASILVQLLGLDAVTLVAIAANIFLRLCETSKECRKLEDRARTLRLLLSSPAGCWITTHMELAGDLVTGALWDAHGLVEAYNESTLFQRVRRGRCIAAKFHDLCSRVDCYCGLILTVNAFTLLLVQANPHPLVLRAEVNDGDVAPSTGYSTEAEISSPAALRDSHVIGTYERPAGVSCRCDYLV